jgi:hypothetical protein
VIAHVERYNCGCRYVYREYHNGSVCEYTRDHYTATLLYPRHYSALRPEQGS